MSKGITFCCECDTCIHSDICAYKDCYEEYLDNLEEKGNEFITDDSPIDVLLKNRIVFHMCNFYRQ